MADSTTTRRQHQRKTKSGRTQVQRHPMRYRKGRTGYISGTARNRSGTRSREVAITQRQEVRGGKRLRKQDEGFYDMDTSGDKKPDVRLTDVETTEGERRQKKHERLVPKSETPGVKQERVFSVGGEKYKHEFVSFTKGSTRQSANAEMDGMIRKDEQKGTPAVYRAVVLKDDKIAIYRARVPQDKID